MASSQFGATREQIGGGDLSDGRSEGTKVWGERESWREEVVESGGSNATLTPKIKTNIKPAEKPKLASIFKHFSPFLQLRPSGSSWVELVIQLQNQYQYSPFVLLSFISNKLEKSKFSWSKLDMKNSLTALCSTLKLKGAPQLKLTLPDLILVISADDSLIIAFFKKKKKHQIYRGKKMLRLMFRLFCVYS